MKKLVEEQEFIQYAKEVIQLDYGSQKAFAEQHDISAAYVNDILLGRRQPGKKFLEAFGAQKVVSYRLL